MDITPERLAELRRFKMKAIAAENAAIAAKDEHVQFQADLFQDMREQEIRSVNTETAQFVARSTIYATVQDQDAFQVWAQEKGLEEDYFTPKPAKARLNELVRDRIDSGEDMPPGISFYPRDYISISDN